MTMNLPRIQLKIIGWTTDSSNKQPIINWKHKFLAIMSFIMALESFLNFYNQMSNVDSTYSAFEELQGAILYACIMGDLLFRPEKYCYLLRLLEDGVIRHKYEKHDRENVITNSNKKFYHRMENVMAMIFLIYGIVIPLVSIMTVISLLFMEKPQPSEYEMLPEPWFHSLLFIKVESYASYSLIVILQAIYTSLFTCAYCNICLFITNSMTKLTCELRYLAFYTSLLGSMNSKSDQTLTESRLKKDVKCLVDHHVAIIRSVEKSNSALNFCMGTYNQVLCFHISTTLYRAVMSEGLSEKASFVIAVILSIIVLYVKCKAGQELANESEEVSKALMECSWLDKSESFKRSLQIMMIASKKQLQFKVVGLYALDHRTFLTVLQASYSYFNLMQSFSH